MSVHAQRKQASASGQSSAPTPPDRPEGWIKQINVCLESGQYKKAGQTFQQARLEFSENKELCELETLIQEAAQLCLRAEQLLAEGERLLKERRAEEGFARLRRALELDAFNPRIRTSLAGALVERARLMLEQDWRACGPLLQQALDLDPGNEPALTLRKALAYRQPNSSRVTCLPKFPTDRLC